MNYDAAEVGSPYNKTTRDIKVRNNKITPMYTSAKQHTTDKEDETIEKLDKYEDYK